MSYYKPVYCEIAFLKDFLSVEDKDTAIDINTSIGKMTKEELLSFIYSDSIDLHLDISDEQLSEIIDEINDKQKIESSINNEGYELTSFEKLMMKLYLDVEKGSYSLKLSGDKFWGLTNISYEDVVLDAIYLTCADADTCRLASRTYGVCVISPTTLSSQSVFQKNTGGCVRKDEVTTWPKLLNNRRIYTCNSMIIADNYLFDDERNMPQNFYTILNTFIPQNLGVPFHLTIFTQLGNPNDNNAPRDAGLYDKLKDHISRMRPNVELVISLFDWGKRRLHDRIIITNNQWFDCPAGFDLFRFGKVCKSTTYSVIYPFINQHTDIQPTAYRNFLCDIYDRYSEITDRYNPRIVGNMRCYWGVKENRLLDQLKTQ